MTATTAPVTEAKRLWEENQKFAKQYMAARKLAAMRALPSHKQRAADAREIRLFTMAHLAEEAFMEAYNKLTAGQRRKLAEMVREEHAAKTI
jgi:hypothetical protein